MKAITRGLPANIAAGVGRVIARWAYQEHLMKLILCQILQMDIKTARMVLRDPSIEQFVPLVRDLLAFKNLSVGTDLTAFALRLKNAKEKRDMLAHSVWGLDRATNQRGVQITRGAWNIDADPPLVVVHVKKKIMPGWQVIDRHYLSVLRQEINEIIKTSRKVGLEIHAAQRAQHRTASKRKLP